MEETKPADDPAHADIGIVCALKLEVDPFLDRCDRLRKYTGGDFTFRGGLCGADYEIRVAIVESGTGVARARRATRRCWMPIRPAGCSRWALPAA